MKAMIYTRVSSEEQVSNLSLDVQEKTCRDYCARNGWTVEAVYREEGESAKTANRTELRRMLTDLRFASAHEQLVLGQGRVWIGDCMRRDPAKRDAFEMYHDNHVSTAAHATASFSKLWDKSVSLTRIVATTVATDLILAGQAATDAADATTRR